MRKKSATRCGEFTNCILSINLETRAEILKKKSLDFLVQTMTPESPFEINCLLIDLINLLLLQQYLKLRKISFEN